MASYKNNETEVELISKDILTIQGYYLRDSNESLPGVLGNPVVMPH